MNDDLSPRRILGMGALAFTAVVVVIAAAVVLGVGTWQLGWFVAAKNVQRQNGITQQQERNTQAGVANQSGVRDQIGNLFTDMSAMGRDKAIQPADTSFDNAEIASDAGKICALIPQLDPGTAQAGWAAFAKANCLDGALSPNSPLGR